MNKHMRVARNIVALLVNQVGTWSVSLVFALVIPPYLGVSRFGLFSFISSYIAYFALGISLGTGTYLTWRIAREPEQAGRLTFNTLLLQAPLALVCGALALALLPLIDHRGWVLELAVVGFVSVSAGALISTCNAALAGLQILRTPARISLAAAALATGLMLLGVYLRADLLYFVICGTTGQCVGLVAILIYTWRHIRIEHRIDLRLWRTVLLGGLPFFAWSAVLLFYGHIDISLLKILVGDTEIGWYAAAYRIISITVFLPTIVVTALLPALSAERTPESPQFRQLVSRCIRLVTVVSVPASVGLVMLSGRLLHLLRYPSSFDQATPLIAILALHIPVIALDMVLGTAIIAIGRQNAWTGVGVVAALFNPLANLWAIPFTQRAYGDGAIGAAVVTVLTELLMLVGALILRPRTVFTRWDVFFIFRCVLAAGVMVPAVWALAAQRSVGVVPAVGYGFILYGMAAYTLRVVRNEDLAGLVGVIAARTNMGDLTRLDWRRVAALLGVRPLGAAVHDGATRLEASVEQALGRGIALVGDGVASLGAWRAGSGVHPDADPQMPDNAHDIRTHGAGVAQAQADGAAYNGRGADDTVAPGTPIQRTTQPAATPARELVLAGLGAGAVSARTEKSSQNGSGERMSRGLFRIEIAEANGHSDERGGRSSGETRQGTATAVERTVSAAVGASGAAQLSMSVVICTRDRPGTIGRAVESVAQQQYVAHDVLVVDQSAGDETRRIVQGLMERYPHVRYMHLDECGRARACNAGIRHTRGEVIAFTDDDCEATETWVAAIAQSFADEPDAQVVYGQVLLPEELQARENVDGITPFLPIPQRRRLNRSEGFQIYGMGANVAVRRAICERLGGYDEMLGVGGPLQSSEDFDFAFRVYRSGGTILLDPASVVYHYGFRAHADWPLTLKGYGTGDGAFYAKHVRLGDAYAAWLLARRLGWSTARELKRLVRYGPRATEWIYVRSFLRGMGESFKYDVDRQWRVYRPHTHG
jgi:O-antigen/teichoic acid export membrane protein/GT2 family glycosyltransferase